MDTVIQVVMIILSIVLIVIVLLQSKGSSFSGGFGGDTGGVYRTRRGFEKSLFESTIVVAIIWVIFAAISSLVT